MKKRNYKYRIKTLEEFETEYGINWRTSFDHHTSFPENMDFLLGTDVAEEDEWGNNINDILDKNKEFVYKGGGNRYRILVSMVKKIILKPTYNKKELKY